MSPPIQPYPFSPLVFIFPALSAVKFAALAASIREHGLLEPKAVWRGQVRSRGPQVRIESGVFRLV